MKANSQVREVQIQEWWKNTNVYERNLDQRKKGNKFVLHDGPPYLSSGKIHLGHALNKILKDIITKYKAMQGYYSPYVPGYDSHGLPIETAVVKDVKGGHRTLEPLELRRRCREFALKNLKGQEDNFKRLGVWGDWAHPYITLDKKFEAAQLRVFGQMADKGYLYKGLKSVTWCATCETALAEAEIEYAEHTSHAVYVKFAVEEDSKKKLAELTANKLDISKNVFFVIWTTTPWTLPANLAIAVNKEFSYDLLEMSWGDVFIIASDLTESFLNDSNTKDEYKQTIAQVKGQNLEHLQTKHPFINRKSPIILGEHVTTEAGTGCVHIAPDHGPEDFELGNKYKLGSLNPVDSRGIYTNNVETFAGQRFDKAIPQILELMTNNGSLVHTNKFQHSYPHCWRCKKPLIFRATEQWFASIDGFRQKALSAIDTVKWIPESGRNRIYNMVENRSDWCISRQRSWGVPIPVFYCRSCNDILMNLQTINRIADIFAEKGSDIWWEKNAEYFLPPGTNCSKCQSKEFRKETDIMDVWFDSGSTHAAVLDERPELKGTPCEMYLEGSDQHRGWFQSSLLTSIATKGIAPYKTVLTHGFTLDETGRKMSKSLGNVVEPDAVIGQYGADVLRLWIASVNYTDDIPIGKNMLAQLAETYRKLRNTARYLLGNLYDYDPATDHVNYDDLKDVDKFILHRLQIVIKNIREDFDKYEFFKYYQVLQNFCVVDLSSFYFDIVKDRLYTAAPKSVSRRAVQTVLAELVRAIALLLAPVTPHLAEDIWSHVPEKIKQHWNLQESVLLNDFPKEKIEFIDEKKEEFWSDMLGLRVIVNKALEEARAARFIGSSLEAQVHICIDNEKLEQKAHSIKNELPALFITSQVELLKAHNPKDERGLAFIEEDNIKVLVLKASGIKCARCWKFTTDVGSNKEYSDICLACAEAVQETAQAAI